MKQLYEFKGNLLFLLLHHKRNIRSSGVASYHLSAHFSERKENGGVKRSGVTSRSSALQVNLREKENFLITLMYNKVFRESNSRGTIG